MKVGNVIEILAVKEPSGIWRDIPKWARKVRIENISGDEFTFRMINTKLKLSHTFKKCDVKSTGVVVSSSIVDILNKI